MLGVRRLERATNLEYRGYAVPALDWAGTMGVE
jgi:hypothetical protein